MKEIKFRAIGWCTHWIYGHLRHYARNPHTEKWTIYQPSTGIETDIDETTICQFTGLTDKNGTDIYEGDIVQWDKDQKLYVVEFRSGMFYSVEPFNPHIYGGFPLWCLCEEEQHCTIVGNIFDTHELIKKKNKKNRKQL